MEKIHETIGDIYFDNMLFFRTKSTERKNGTETDHVQIRSILAIVSSTLHSI